MKTLKNTKREIIRIFFKRALPFYYLRLVLAHTFRLLYSFSVLRVFLSLYTFIFYFFSNEKLSLSHIERYP